jgi:hypothetical protein
MAMIDSIVESVRQDLLDRSEVGIKKYNTTLDRDDLEITDWITHAYQELLDGALYLKKLNQDVEGMVEWTCKLEQELILKNKIIENLVKVIKSQEDEITELKKVNYNQEKRRNWHY